MMLYRFLPPAFSRAKRCPAIVAFQKFHFARAILARLKGYSQVLCTTTWAHRDPDGLLALEALSWSLQLQKTMTDWSFQGIVYQVEHTPDPSTTPRSNSTIQWPEASFDSTLCISQPQLFNTLTFFQNTGQFVGAQIELFVPLPWIGWGNPL